MSEFKPVCIAVSFQRMAEHSAWQATLEPHDPDHDQMFRVDADRGALAIFWGGYHYDLDLDDIVRPEDLLWSLSHIARKTWRHMTARRIALLIAAVAHHKGWTPFSRVPHPNECPPAFHDAKAEREKLTPALRYAVIRRDGSRCRCCGASVSTGAVLHVDHIIPIAKGGLTKITNLQALCAVCNQGKAAS